MKQESAVKTEQTQTVSPIAVADGNYHEILNRKFQAEKDLSTAWWSGIFAQGKFLRLQNEMTHSKNTSVEFMRELDYLRKQLAKVEARHADAKEKLEVIKAELAAHPLSQRQAARDEVR